MTRGSGVKEGNYASSKGSQSQRDPDVNQELTFPSLQTSKGVGEGEELRNDSPLVDEATVLPSQPSDLPESSEPRRKGLRSAVAKRKVEGPVETKNTKPPARSRPISNAPKGRKRKQPKRRDKNDSAAQHAPSISPCPLSKDSIHRDKRSVDPAGSQISKSQLGLSSLHPGPVTTVRSEVRNLDLTRIPGLEKPDTKNLRRCSSEPPVSLPVAFVLQGCPASSTSIPAEAQSRDIGDHPETRSWARQFPTHIGEASAPTSSRLPAISSSTQKSSLVLDNRCSTNVPRQKMSNSDGPTLVVAVVESTEAHCKPGGSTSCHLNSTGQDRLVVDKGLLRRKEVRMPGHSTCEASDCIPTSEDYNSMKRNLVASENTYKRLSAAYQEFHRSNTIAHQRASHAESELKRLKKELNRVQKENTEYKAKNDRFKQQAKQKSHQAVVGAQQESPIVLGPQGEFDNVQTDMQDPEVLTTKSPSQISHCERPEQDPFEGAWISPPLSVVNAQEPCMPEMEGVEGVDACGGQKDWNEFGELGKGLDNLDWGDMDPMEIERACNSMFEDVPQLLPL